MRGRTDHPTTVPDAPDPTGPDDDRVVYHLTDAGRQALADTDPSADPPPDASNDDTPSPTAHASRAGTVCGRTRDYGRVPEVRLSGWWLQRAGFDLGVSFEIEVHTGRLVIEAAAG